MSALDLDALERLTRAYADAHAAMLADDRSAQAWLDDEAASKALAAHYGGQWASPAQCVDVLALITRLRAAESEASSAGVLRCKLTHEEAQTEAAGRALEMVAPGLLAEHGAIFSAVLELGARLRAAEARIERVGAILSDEGCDCYCDCDSDGHNADCDLCLACRIDREVSP